MSLEETLKEHWPPKDVTLSCQKCNDFALKGSDDVSNPSLLTALIRMEATRHMAETGHNAFDIDIEVVPKAEASFDIEVTVNG